MLGNKMVPSSKKQLERKDPRLHPKRLYPLGLNYSRHIKIPILDMNY